MDKKTLVIDGVVFVGLLTAGAWFYLTQYAPATQSTASLNTLTATTTNMEQKNEGLKIETLTKGNGLEAQNGNTLIVDYTGVLLDGTVFDSSIPRGKPFTLHLGSGEVIKGWDMGLLGMRVGEKRRLTILPELAYGTEGFPGVIPPNATLIFEITLKAIQ